MAFLDQGLVLRRPSSLASESFLLVSNPGAMRHSSLITLLMLHFQGHMWHELSLDTG